MAANVYFTLDLPTVLSIVVSLSLMPAAMLLSRSLIPANKTRDRLLFFWHAYDALTHLLIEGSFAYHCFFSYTTVVNPSDQGPHWFNDPTRLYGPNYGTGPTARLWQEYAKADRRWGGTDTGVVSLELLTVLIGGPTAVYICYLLYRSNAKLNSHSCGSVKATLWFFSIALATAELYGGFMTFAPEWLTGSTALVTEDPVYLWLYLVFFNTLWVFIPLWVLWEASKELRGAFVGAETQAWVPTCTIKVTSYACSVHNVFQRVGLRQKPEESLHWWAHRFSSSGRSLGRLAQDTNRRKLSPGIDFTHISW